MNDNEQKTFEDPDSSLFNNDPYFKSKQSYNNIIISQTLEILGD